MSAKTLGGWEADYQPCPTCSALIRADLGHSEEQCANIKRDLALRMRRRKTDRKGAK